MRYTSAPRGSDARWMVTCAGDGAVGGVAAGRAGDGLDGVVGEADEFGPDAFAAAGAADVGAGVGAVGAGAGAVGVGAVSVVADDWAGAEFGDALGAAAGGPGAAVWAAVGADTTRGSADATSMVFAPCSLSPPLRRSPKTATPMAIRSEEHTS